MTKPHIPPMTPRTSPIGDGAACNSNPTNGEGGEGGGEGGGREGEITEMVIVGGVTLSTRLLSATRPPLPSLIVIGEYGRPSIKVTISSMFPENPRVTTTEYSWFAMGMLGGGGLLGGEGKRGGDGGMLGGDGRRGGDGGMPGGDGGDGEGGGGEGEGGGGGGGDSGGGA